MKYKRVLLKLSGEALAKSDRTGIDFDKMLEISGVLKECLKEGLEIAIVVGGGNFWRGRYGLNMERTTSDYMGILDIVDFYAKELATLWCSIDQSIINARFAMPFDKEQLINLAKKHKYLVTMEENIRSGGFGEHVAAFVHEQDLDMKVHIVAIPNMYVEHGNVDVLKKTNS